LQKQRAAKRLDHITVSAGLLVRRTYRLDSIKQNGQHEEEGGDELTRTRPSQSTSGRDCLRYLCQLDSADRREPSDAFSIKTTKIKEKIAWLKQEISRLEVMDAQMRNTDQQIPLTDLDARSMVTSGRGDLA
jgi:hypothetical protein